VLAPGSERELLEALRAAAAVLGWLSYHTHDSRRSEAGFPDLALVRDPHARPIAGPRIIYLELKSATGRTTAAQDRMIEALAAADQAVYVLRPQDLTWALEALAGRGTGQPPSGAG
jgi:hypothetical protein